MIWLLLVLLFPSIAFTQEKEIEIITTGEKNFPVGKTTNPSFDIPANTTGEYSLSIKCDPLATVVVDAGPLSKFTRKPGTCIDRNGDPLTHTKVIITRRDGNGNLAPLEVKPVQTFVTTDRALTSALEISFDKTK